jgi:PIN domain nuclease of toxin-antitoxin system
VTLSGLLLDTHYAYALAGAPGSLSPAEQLFLSHPPGRLVISAVSIWEMRLKWQALYLSGGRKGPMDPARALDILRGQPIDFLALTPAHAAATLDHPIEHHDPFDALLLVQAQIENLQLLTRDSKLTAHPLGRAV